MAKNYKCPCGFVDTNGSEEWIYEATCSIVGCKFCEHFNGTEYYERNVAKGISLWANRERIKLNGGSAE